MTASAPRLVTTWSVGKRYRVTLTVPSLVDGTSATAVCEWDPAMPTRLTPRELRDYERGCDAALRELAEQGASKPLRSS